MDETKTTENQPKFHNESTQHASLTSLLQKNPIVDNSTTTITTTNTSSSSSSSSHRNKSISSSNPFNEFLKPHSILSQNNSSESDDDDDLSHHDDLYLQMVEPLANQVGGHTRLLLLNEKTVIKPLNFRELEFYQNIPIDIQRFVPKYKGKLTVCSICVRYE
jgi:hypothetical protein